MVKRREKKEHSEADIERFINAADNEQQAQQSASDNLDPNAKRNYKNIRLGLNKYEYERLQLLADKTSRNKINAIRWSIEKMIEQLDADASKL